MILLISISADCEVHSGHGDNVCTKDKQQAKQKHIIVSKWTHLFEEHSWTHALDYQ